MDTTTMNPEEQSERAEAIFEAALELPQEKRAAHIAEACGSNSSLFAEVQALLSAQDAAPTGFLDEPADLDVTVKIDPSQRPTGQIRQA